VSRFAGVLAVIVLVLGIAQLPALLVTLPVIGWIWASGDYATVPAAAYSVLLFVGGMADNVLKPIMLGRGVDAPMPVILIGALGGMATGGILGMFIGATALALGYQIFMRWVDDNPERALQGRRRFALHRRLSRCGDASRCSSASACSPSPVRCCSGAAPQSGRTSSAPKWPGWPTGRAARSTRWRPNSAASRERRPRSGGELQRPGARPLVAEAQRANPNVRTAGMRILEARAQLGDCRQPALSAAAAVHRQACCAPEPR
jgi:hypothetical protein